MSEASKVVLVHVSDLHFRELHQEGPAPEPVVQWWWQLAPWFDGYLGHDYAALLQLQMLVKDIREEHDGSPIYIVATGDLTANGAARQAKDALSFLTDRIAIGDQLLGLRGAANTVVISGNHDNWPGSNVMLGQRPPWLDELGVMPDVALRRPINKHHELVIARIDSDASTTRRERVLARGSFVQQCEELATQLGEPEPHQLRVLLVHHSYQERGLTLAMNSASRRALRSLVRACGIKRVLTGHAHEVDVRLHTSECPELRCGTSTQISEFPPHWKVARLHQRARLRSLHRNTVLVHVLEAYSRKLFWKTETWVRPRVSGYGPDRAATIPFELDPIRSSTTRLR